MTTVKYMVIMKRGPKDAAAEVLEQVISNPKLAPSKVMARTTRSYDFLKVLVGNSLVEVQKTGKRKGKLVITDKGREFLQHYRVCNTLFPV